MDESTMAQAYMMNMYSHASLYAILPLHSLSLWFTVNLYTKTGDNSASATVRAHVMSPMLLLMNLNIAIEAENVAIHNADRYVPSRIALSLNLLALFSCIGTFFRNLLQR